MDERLPFGSQYLYIRERHFKSIKWFPQDKPQPSYVDQTRDGIGVPNFNESILLSCAAFSYGFCFVHALALFLIPSGAIVSSIHSPLLLCQIDETRSQLFLMFLGDTRPCLLTSFTTMKIISFQCNPVRSNGASIRSWCFSEPSSIEAVVSLFCFLLSDHPHYSN